MGNTPYNPLNAGDAFNQDAPAYDYPDITPAEIDRALDRLDELVESTRENLGE